jgi:hypothetical protein
MRFGESKRALLFAYAQGQVTARGGIAQGLPNAQCHLVVG